MFTVRLPNGKEQTFDATLSLEEVLRNTTFNSEQDAIACRVNGKLAHGSYTISHDALLEIITSADEDGLRILRHSTAHLLACAVKTLFPDAKVAMGPVIEDGFYYDFSYPRPFTRENMAEIESKMRELAKKNEPIVRKPIPHQEALQ